MKDMFTANWNDLIEIVSNQWLTPIKTFILRYTLQAKMHTIWWERNSRKHGEKPRDMICLTKIVDKTVGLKLLSVKENGKALLRRFDNMV